MLLALAILPAINAPAAYAAEKASAPAEVCDYLQFCAYTSPNEQGVYQVILAQPQNTCVNLDPELRSQISSVTNRTNWSITLFAGDNCTGESKFIESGVGYPDLRVQAFNKKLRSIRFDRLWPADPPCVGGFGAYLCLYANTGYGGEVQVIGPRDGENKCVNLQPAFKGQVSSVRNQLPSQDAVLFDGDDCTGTSVDVAKGQSRSDLGGLNFDNRLRSVKLRPMVTCDPARSGLCLFTESGYAGLSQLVGPSPAGTCVNLGSTLAGQVSSVHNLLAGQRITLLAGENCQGRGLQIEAGQAIDDLSTRQFDDMTRSVKFLPPPDQCEYQFHNVCVYADLNFAGERQVIAPDTLNTCVNLQASLQAKVSSILNNANDKVTFYAGLNCTGESDWISAGVGYPNLPVQEFNDKMRSLRYTPL